MITTVRYRIQLISGQKGAGSIVKGPIQEIARINAFARNEVSFVHSRCIEFMFKWYSPSKFLYIYVLVFTEYIVITANRTCHDEGFIDLSNKKDCWEAAAFVGFRFIQTSTLFYPSACFIKDRSTCWNENPNGVANNNAKAIFTASKYLIS